MPGNESVKGIGHEVRTCIVHRAGAICGGRRAVLRAARRRVRRPVPGGAYRCHGRIAPAAWGDLLIKVREVERETGFEPATFCLGSEGLAVVPGCLQPHEDRHVSAWALPAELVTGGTG